MVRAQRGILAVGQPAKAIADFAVPWCLLLPVYFLYVFDSVESKVKLDV